MTNPVSQTSAIEVIDVIKRFGPVTALDRVSFAVEPGELFFLLGPSGCGKTTMLRILAGLETADSGLVKLSGRDTARLPPHLRGAPMVFQNYALWPHLKVRENVAFGLVERRVARNEISRRVEAALEQVSLPGLGDRLPGQLSGGQQQRVVLARALVLNPEVILLDEPLSNLDAKLRGEMRDEIERLHRETAITFVYVTHDQVEALSLADRVAVMQNGRIRALGGPRELYQRPPNLFCADFLGESNFISGTVDGWEGDRVRVRTALGDWTAVHPGHAAPARGSAVRCLVRPECIAPAGKAAERRTEGAAEGNRFEAEVRAVRFHGPTVSVTLAAAGQILKCTRLTAQVEGLEGLRVGSRLTWRVDIPDTILIEEE